MPGSRFTADNSACLSEYQYIHQTLILCCLYFQDYSSRVLLPRPSGRVRLSTHIFSRTSRSLTRASCTPDISSLARSSLSIQVSPSSHEPCPERCGASVLSAWLSTIRSSLWHCPDNLHRIYRRNKRPSRINKDVRMRLQWHASHRLTIRSER